MFFFHFGLFLCFMFLFQHTVCFLRRANRKFGVHPSIFPGVKGRKRLILRPPASTQLTNCPSLGNGAQRKRRKTTKTGFGKCTFFDGTGQKSGKKHQVEILVVDSSHYLRRVFSTIQLKGGWEWDFLNHQQ